MFADSNAHRDDEPVGLEERYSAATGASNLMVTEHRPGPARLLVAAGLAAKDELQGSKARSLDKPSVALGGALARLQSEWHSVEKPQRRQARSVRQWMDLLPLVKTGERTVKGQPVPIMSRDKDGARERNREEAKTLEALYAQELVLLAQKLPSRYWVRSRLYAVAILWKVDEPEQAVAAVLEHWMDDTCRTCRGTGEVMKGEKVVTCDICKGQKKSPVPHGQVGWDLLRLMNESKHAWKQTVSARHRRLRPQP